MKKTIVVLSMIMIIAITAIGCQKTPESPLIIGKSSDDLIDKASEGLSDESVAEKVNAPLQYEADFVSSDGMTAVSVNAAIDVPEASTAPIIRISTGSISQEQADVLLTLLKNKNLTVSREQLLSDVWGYEYAGETRAVDMKISNLRKKLNLGDAIRAIPKLGYRLEER